MGNNFVLFKNNKSKSYYIFFINHNLKIEISKNLYRTISNYPKSNEIVQDKIKSILETSKDNLNKENVINNNISMFNSKKISINEVNTKNKEIVFLGFPYDLGSSNYSGSRWAPSLLREYSGSLYDYFNNDFVKLPLMACDIGDIHRRIFRTNGKEFDFSSNIIEYLISCNKIPIILGGDHSISYSTIKGVINSKKKFGIIHFDSHQDFQIELSSEECWNENLHHGNFFNWLVANKEIEHIYQFGIDEYSKKYINKKIDTYTTKEVLSNIDNILENIDKSIEYYLTFDVDCLSTEFIVSTGTPIPGGFTYREINYIIDKLEEFNVKIMALDFVELNDKNRIDSLNICKIILDFIKILR